MPSEAQEPCWCWCEFPASPSSMPEDGVIRGQWRQDPTVSACFFLQPRRLYDRGGRAAWRCYAEMVQSKFAAR